MRNRTLPPSIIIGVTAIASAACSSTTSSNQDQTTSATPGSSSVSSSLPQHGAPAVTTPLPTAATVSNPYTTASKDQVAQVGGQVSSSRVDHANRRQAAHLGLRQRRRNSDCRSRHTRQGRAQSPLRFEGAE